ncbi:MAG: polysaccharide biosynthesis C-terminal domain-containing protein [bacterium]|nr:polysaccharide biosynthesis C-terminal domain-containing protein [bacterium]
MIKDSVYTLITRLFIILGKLIYSVFINRTLGPTLKGAYELITMAPNTLVYFGSLGFNQSNIFFAGKKPGSIPNLISNAYFMTAVFSLPTIALGAGYMLLPQNAKIWDNVPIWVGFLALVVIPIGILDMYLESILYGENRIWVRNFHEVLRMFSSIVYIGIMVVALNWAIQGAIFGFILLNLTIFSFVFVVLRYYHKPVRPRLDRELAKESWKFAMFPWGSNLFGYLVLKVDIWLLNALAHGTDYEILQQVGLYATAGTAMATIWVIPEAIHTAVLPKIIQKGESERRKLMPPSIRATTALVILAIIGTILVAKPLLVLLYNRPGASWDYTLAYIPLMLLMPGTLLFALAKIFSADLFSRGKPHYAMWATAATLLSDIILNIILIPCNWTIGTLPIGGMNGAAIASSTSYFVLFLSLLIIYLRESGENPMDLFIPKRSDIAIIKDLAVKAWEKFGNINKINREGDK